MRLRTRLILGILLATLLPLLLLGLAATQHATRTVIDRAVALHVQKTANISTFVNTYMGAQVKSLSLMMRTFSVATLGEKEQVGFQRLVYNQMDEVNIVSLLGPAGMDVAPSQLHRTESPVEPPPGHDAISDARFSAFRQHVPLAQALEKGVAVGRPYLPPDTPFPVVPIALAAPPPGEPVVLAVELSLRNVVAQMENQISEDMEVALLDQDGAIIATRGQNLLRRDVFELVLGGTPVGDLQYELEDGTRVLAAFTHIPSTGWLSVAAEPYASVARSGRDIQRRTAYFGVVAAVLAVAIGWIFASRIHRPVAELREASVAVGDGRLGFQVQPDRIRELGDLGRAFNGMSTHLKMNRDEIDKQRAEIESFNAELQARVEERTRELKEAQARLVESGKLAAVAELGAGLAHELNNPLAGVLGIAQILRSTGDSQPLLLSLEAQAQRCADILRSLQGLTTDDGARQDREPVDLDPLMAEVVSLTRGAFQQRSIQIQYTRSREPLRVRATGPKVAQALTQLLTSLRALVPEGGQLKIHGLGRTGEVEFQFQLDPVPPLPSAAGRDGWLASGMSLWVARGILAEHGGCLHEPEPGNPGTYRLVLPEA